MLHGFTRSWSALDFRRSAGARFMLALGLAILAGVAVFAAVQERDGNGALAPGPAIAPVTVAVAAQDIPAGQLITSGMLRSVELPPDAVLAAALPAVDLAVGRVARIPIYAGEQLVPDKLATVGGDANSLGHRVPEGMRALAVHVDKVIGAGGLLRPGDRVDVLAVVTDPSASARAGGSVVRQALTIAQNVAVLAVEQELVNVPAAPPAAGSADGTLVDQPEAQPAGTVATLAVTPRAAEEIFLAEEGGAIRLAVRAPGDVAVVAGTDETLPAAAAIASPEPGGLGVVVPVGLRAFAVAIDRVIGAGGLLQPGDRVDIVGVLEVQKSDIMGSAGVRLARAVTIAQDVEVLAIEQAVVPALTDPAGADRAVATDVVGGQPLAAVATLALTPLQAQQVLLVETQGVIRLSARAAGDRALESLEDSTYISVTDPSFQGLIDEAFRTLATP